MNSKTDCSGTRQNLHLYLGGEIEPAGIREVEHHLEHCPGCRAELATARDARERYLTAVVDSDAEELDLWPGVRSRLVSEGILDPRHQAGPPGTSWSRRAPWIAAAAAALLLALPFLQSGEPMNTPTPSAGGGDPVRPTPVVEHREVGARAPAVADNDRLRQVLEGDESLLERAWREYEEDVQNGRIAHPQDTGAYDVVNRRRGLR